jgi:hypothetical protein
VDSSRRELREPVPPDFSVRRESRRRFLKTGILGALALSSAGLVGRWRGASASTADSFAFFRASDIALARAVLESFVEAGLPKQPAERRAAIDDALAVADRYFSAFSPAVQAEALQAFDLLNLWFVRRWIAGVSEPWESAPAQEVNAFLESFRASRFDTLRQIYRLLEGVATVGWYGRPASWPQLGYPGPMQIERPRSEAPL